ncbi:MAG: hypothetical protein WC091_24050 [Sulfuricellaceae bacterium]
MVLPLLSGSAACDEGRLMQLFDTYAPHPPLCSDCAHCTVNHWRDEKIKRGRGRFGYKPPPMPACRRVRDVTGWTAQLEQARRDGEPCGPDGALFKKYVPVPKIQPPPPPSIWRTLLGLGSPV